MINQRGFAPIIFLIFGFVILSGVGGGGYYFYHQQKMRSVTDFESCAKLYPVLTSYPGQCNTPDGRHFVQLLSEEEQKKLVPPSVEPSVAADVVIVSPSPSAVVNSKIRPALAIPSASPVVVEDYYAPVKLLPLATYQVTPMNISKWKRMDYEFGSYLYPTHWKIRDTSMMLGTESSPFEIFDIDTGSFPTEIALGGGMMGVTTIDDYTPSRGSDYKRIDYKVKNVMVHSFQGVFSSDDYKNGLPVYDYHFVFAGNFPVHFGIDREGEPPLQQTIDELLTLISTYKEKELH